MELWHHHWFVTPKNKSRPNLRRKKSFYQVLWCFWLFFDHFGVQWRQSRGQDFKILGLWHHYRFFRPKNISRPNLRRKTSFYKVLWWFWWFLDHFGVQWRQNRGQDFKILGMWHHHRFFRLKKHIKTKFEEKSVILQSFMVILVIFGPFWGSLTSQ